MRKVCVLMWLMFFVCVPEAFAQASEPSLRTRLEPVVERTMRKHGIPGLAIGVVKNGRVVYAKGFGVSKLGGNEPVTTRSIFHMASVTKVFTATAVMQLVERRKLSLDAQVTQYLPYFKMNDERYKQITVRQLLNHTSGVPFVEENPFELKPVYDAGALERHVRALSSLALSFAPGERTEYSNYGYDVLGDVIAKVSGVSYEDYVRRNILEPLGMRSSTLLVREVPRQLLLTPHFSDQGGKVSVSEIFPYTRAFTPSSNLYSNVDDMNRWLIASLNRGMLEGKRILKATSYDTLWKLPVEAEPGTEFPLGGKMGGGWFRWDYKGHQLVGHGGADLGFNSFLVVAPNDSAAVIVMGNLYPAKVNYLPTGTYYTADVAKAAMDLILDGTGAANFDYLNVRGNTVETTHQARYTIKITDSFRF